MQFLIMASALLGLAFGRFTGYDADPGNKAEDYPGYPEFPGNFGVPFVKPGYGANPGNKGIQGYPEYPEFPDNFGVPSAEPVEVNAKGSKTIIPIYRPSAASGPHPSKPYFKILEQSREMYPNGEYDYNYLTENGIYVVESGRLVQTPKGPSIAAKGGYSYTSPEGIPVRVGYIADKSGYHPTVQIGRAASYPGYPGHPGYFRSPLDDTRSVDATAVPAEM